ncbi:hypothetical protein COOONC_17535 [Cooperia oncophora]
MDEPHKSSPIKASKDFGQFTAQLFRIHTVTSCNISFMESPTSERVGLSLECPAYAYEFGESVLMVPMYH